MIEHNFLRGDLVRLTAEEPETYASYFSRWSRDAEYDRLLSSESAIPRSLPKVKEWYEKNRKKNPSDFYAFMIRCLEDDRIIGETALDGVLWNQGDAFVSISIGERGSWGKGYGTDAMRIILRFAFDELNLHRVSLDVFDYNPRAIRSYEKVGFVHEGRHRGAVNKSGKRYDMLFMGILRSEWQAKYGIDREKEK
jgi:RimJ/RimL family protein N-acetyltransferase